MSDIVIKSENLFWEDKNGDLTPKHFRPVITEHENINNVVNIDGRFILAQDTGRMYYDNNGKRVELGNAGLDYVQLVGTAEEANKDGIIYVIPDNSNDSNSVFEIRYNNNIVGKKTLAINNALYAEKSNFNIDYIQGNTNNVVSHNQNGSIAFGLKDGTRYTVAGYKTLYIPKGSGNNKIQAIGENNLIITLNDEPPTSIVNQLISIDGGDNYPYCAKVMSIETNNGLRLELRRGLKASDFAAILISKASEEDLYIVCDGYSELSGGQTFGSAQVAMGIANHAIGKASAAFGRKNYTSGGYSFAAGRENRVAQYGVAFGKLNKVDNTGAAAFGFNNIADGEFSIATGNCTVASGRASFAGGVWLGEKDSETMASGDCAFAYGWNAIASGKCSFAFGVQPRAKGDHTVAMGMGSKVYGDHSIALGKGSEVNASDSIALGNYNFIQSPHTILLGENLMGPDAGIMVENGVNKRKPCYSTIVGRYNSIGDSTNYPIFAVGNGTSESDRKNAFEISAVDNCTLINQNLALETSFHSSWTGYPALYPRFLDTNFETEKLVGGSLGAEKSWWGQAYIDTIDTHTLNVGGISANNLNGLKFSKHFTGGDNTPLVLDFTGAENRGYALITAVANDTPPYTCTYLIGFNFYNKTWTQIQAEKTIAPIHDSGYYLGFTFNENKQLLVQGAAFSLITAIWTFI